MNETNSNRAVQILTALGKAIAYLALFLGSQTLVALCFSISAALSVVLETGTVDLLQMAELLTSYALPMTLISNLLTLAFLAVFFLARRKHVFQQVQLRPVPVLEAMGATSAAPLLYAAVTLALAFLPAAWMADYAQASVALNNTGLLPFLSVALAAPVTEEVVFRGLIQSRLARALPGWPAVLLSALMFALCHGQPVWMGYAFVLGLVLGVMAWRAGSILPSILTHIVFNTIGQILSLPQLAQANGLLVLAVLLLVGIAACLLTWKGLIPLFRPSSEKEPDTNV
ncbi:MAG TPA: CPBP family intramembrane metalloprotease [Candidatus Enterenecus stercoripullorum]|nr:CPBP family intramembrane metalloprotease [Candidatus Enterenecus stercoripullorum]